MPELPALTLAPDPDASAGVVSYHVDPQASPGDVLRPLAAVLIDIFRRRREAEQAAKPQTTEQGMTNIDARQLRVQAIRNSALVRAALGITAGHLLLPDGRHQITTIDRATRALNTYIGDTLAEAIDAAKRGEGYL